MVKSLRKYIVISKSRADRIIKISFAIKLKNEIILSSFFCICLPLELYFTGLTSKIFVHSFLYLFYYDLEIKYAELLIKENIYEKSKMSRFVGKSFFKSLLKSLFFFLTGGHAFIVPQELPSILSLVYSNIPPIKKGTDSRVGFGYRLGEHADFQVLFELGPQTNTRPIGTYNLFKDNLKKTLINFFAVFRSCSW